MKERRKDFDNISPGNLDEQLPFMSNTHLQDLDDIFAVTVRRAVDGLRGGEGPAPAQEPGGESHSEAMHRKISAEIERRRDTGELIRNEPVYEYDE